MGSGNSRPHSYTYVYNEETVRREEKEREVRRLENERKQGDINKQIKKEEIQCIGYEQQHEKEALEKASGKLKRLQLEAELCRSRKELFNYKFGDKTKANENLQPHVTQLRIGLFGPTGSGKSCFINTCERAVRQTEKGLADSSVGEEWTITLQDYLPEMFFHLVDTRGFFNFDYNETVEFQNILYGNVQPGDVIARPVNGQKNAQRLHQVSAFDKQVHGVIIVVKANDPRLRLGKFKEYLQPVRDILQDTGIEPITVVTHHDTLHTEEERQTALKEASEATGSSISHTLFIWNYTKENRTSNPEIERMALKILNSAVTEAEKAVVNIMEKKVPREILERGPAALEAYNKARSEGTTVVKRVPIMLIGQYCSGKTSLKKSLRGQPFNPCEGSTTGIHVDPSHFKVSREIWKVGEKDQDNSPDSAFSYKYHLAQSTVKNLDHKKTTALEAKPAGTISPEDSDAQHASNNLTPESSAHNVADTAIRESAKVSEMSKDPQSSETPESSQKSTDLEPSIKNDSKSEEILSSLTEILLQMDWADGEDIYSMLWDFGGESVYYTTHPIFLSPKAIYLLVNDLSQNAIATAKPIRKQGQYKDLEDSYGLKTNLDYLNFWLSSVASLVGQYESNSSNPTSKVLPAKLPPVFFVCTHADTPCDGGDPMTLAKDIYGSLKEKPSGTHLYKDFFVVDNTKSGQESECSEVVRLRKEVLAASKELPQQSNDIPIKWLQFENVIQKKKEKGFKFISLEDARKIASDECDIGDNEQFMTLLNFLHDQRILIHFDETPELNKLVVLDCQWLIDVFKEIITVRRYEGKEKEFEDLWRKLEKEGILEEKLLKYVWGPLLDESNTCESLLAIMEKFSLICSLPSFDTSCGKKYLVPSMVMSHPNDGINKLVAAARIPSLFLKFKYGQVPSGLFPRLVIQFFQWNKQKHQNLANPNLYHNYARFYPNEKENCSVMLQCHSSSIEVVILGGTPCPKLGESLQSELDLSAEEPFDVRCARDVRRQLDVILGSMRTEFFWLKSMTCEVSFMCPICCQKGGIVRQCTTHHVQGCNQEECLHFLSESEICNVEMISCTRYAVAQDIRVQREQFEPWFESFPTQVTNKELIRTHLASEEEGSDLPTEVQNSLVSPSTCDAETVVRQFKEILQLDQAFLKQPDPKTQKLIQCLAKNSLASHRKDVFEYLRHNTPAGTTGPSLPKHTDVRNIPLPHRKNLTIALSGGDYWKMLADKLGLNNDEICFFNRRFNPCEAVLTYIANKRSISVGYLYDLLVKLECPVIADYL